MALIARLLMASTGLLMIVFVGLVFGLVFAGEDGEIWELADLQPQPFAPHPAGLTLGLFFSVVFLWGILQTFWQAHLLLKAGKQHLFRALSRGLRLCGYGLAMMWAALYAFMNAVPFTLSMGRIPAEELEIQWAPFEIESVFLILAVVMAALAGNLQRAAEIEDENNQFL